MKTLLVQYTARANRSRTAKLANALTQSIKNSELEVLDLTQDVPEMLIKDNLLAYYERNYAGVALEPEREKLLSTADRMCDQFKQADTVVLATPMYNFSMPAIVKAYFDAVMQKGETFDITPQGEYIGLMKGKNALVLATSGAVYKDESAGFEHLSSLASCEFMFMGFDPIKTIFVQGANSLPVEDFENSLNAAQIQIRQIADKWNL